MLAAVRDLYALAPTGFVAARNQLSKELKQAGDLEQAQRVGALRRPRLAEWALNRVARESPAITERFAEAIRAAQLAQSAAIDAPRGGNPEAMRAANAELRAAMASLVEAALSTINTAGGGSGDAQRDTVGDALRAFVASADPAPLLAGVVGAEALGDSVDLFPGASGPVADRAVTKDRGDVGGNSLPRPGRPRPAVEALRRAERHGLEQRVRATEHAVRTAERAIETAAATLRAAKADLADGRARLRAAEKEAQAAARALAAFDHDQ